MVSRQETARPLLTPGEIMQLPPTDELVLVSGLAPIRAKKARYYSDRQLAVRVLPPPGRKPGRSQPTAPADDWSALKPIAAPAPAPICGAGRQRFRETDRDRGPGQRRHPQ